VSEREAWNCSSDTILIAEDDAVYRHILQGWVQNLGYRVIVA
jgi:CheY-like chemotaxis protein